MICYIILTFSAIGNINNVISPSEMYHIFQKKKKGLGFFETIDIKGTTDKFYMHTYFNFIYAFYLKVYRL